MSKIEIKGTDKTPKFVFEPLRGSIKILGRSTMMFPQEHYPTIVKVLEEYAQDPVENTHLFIDLEYYNTLSAKYLLSILKIISRINQIPNKEAKIIWYFEEEDFTIRDDIKLFSKLINHKIHAIEYEMAYA